MAGQCFAEVIRCVMYWCSTVSAQARNRRGYLGEVCGGASVWWCGPPGIHRTHRDPENVSRGNPAGLNWEERTGQNERSLLHPQIEAGRGLIELPSCRCGCPWAPGAWLRPERGGALQLGACRTCPARQPAVTSGFWVLVLFGSMICW